MIRKAINEEKTLFSIGEDISFTILFYKSTDLLTRYNCEKKKNITFFCTYEICQNWRCDDSSILYSFVKRQDSQGKFF